MAKYPTRKRIFDLRGEAHENPDGSSRQAELKRCSPGEQVTLEREPENPHDPNATRVVSARGVCIGYLAAEDAAALASALDAGRPYTAAINELIGGIPDYPSFGSRVAVTWEGQQAPAPKPIRPEQSLYGAQRAGCMGAAALVCLGLPLLGFGAALLG
jgi:hypothetical protein